MQEHVQVEASKCKACHRCEIACIAAHHGLDFKTAMKQKAQYAPRGWAFKGDTFKTSIRCHGCNPAPCCNICPTGALKQNKDGSFEFHMEHCAGCMLCMAVCPYGCISFEFEQQEAVKVLGVNEPVQLPPRKVAVRCDLCADWRTERGVNYTACMEACMTRALKYVKSDGTIIEAPQIEKKASPKPVVEAPKAEEVKVEAPKAEKASEAEETKSEAPKAEKASEVEDAETESPKIEEAQGAESEDKNEFQDGAKNKKRKGKKKK